LEIGLEVDKTVKLMYRLACENLQILHQEKIHEVLPVQLAEDFRRCSGTRLDPAMVS
jgi:hypothetical protein